MEHQKKVEELLSSLGVTANYTGFFYISAAIILCMEHPEQLTMITKQLYPEVARQYKTNWRAVERNIRTAGCVIWRENHPLLEKLARRPLAKKPCNAQLLAILSSGLRSMEPEETALR